MSKRLVSDSSTYSKVKLKEFWEFLEIISYVSTKYLCSCLENSVQLSILVKWPLTRRCCWTGRISLHYIDRNSALQSLSMLVYLGPLVCWQSNAVTGQTHRGKHIKVGKERPVALWVITCNSFSLDTYWFVIFYSVWGSYVSIIMHSAGWYLVVIL